MFFVFSWKSFWAFLILLYVCTKCLCIAALFTWKCTNLCDSYTTIDVGSFPDWLTLTPSILPILEGRPGFQHPYMEGPRRVRTCNPFVGSSTRASCSLRWNGVGQKWTSYPGTPQDTPSKPPKYILPKLCVLNLYQDGDDKENKSFSPKENSDRKFTSKESDIPFASKCTFVYVTSLAELR